MGEEDLVLEVVDGGEEVLQFEGEAGYLVLQLGV